MADEGEVQYWNEFCGVVADKLGVAADRIDRKSLFVKDLGADSLDIVTLLMELEDRFHVTISEKSAAQFESVGAFFDFIYAQVVSNAHAQVESNAQ